MVDLEKLKKAIQKKGLSYSDIAKALGITRSCVSHKMSGEIDFKVSQVYLLAELLELSDEEREEIFYTGEKTENQIAKTAEEKVGIAVEVVNLLSAKKCTIDEAYEILNSAKWTIEHTSTVQKFEWKANPKGGEGMLRDLLKRARAGENVLDEVLKEVLPNQSEEIKKAIANKVPILLLDNVGDGTDPLLYHALKNAGALQVPNYHIMRENGEMKSNCVYLTIFINEKAKEDLQYC